MTVKRLTLLQELLSFIGMEERVHLDWISSAEAQKFVLVVREFVEKIRSLGPNPLPVYTQKQRLTFPADAVNGTSIHSLE